MKRNGTANFITGFLLGALIFGGTAAFAAGVAATKTASKVLVNGQEIQAEAYNIGGSNYFKLRDVASAVNFSVAWDGAGNRILIDTRLGYDPHQQYKPESAPAALRGVPAVEPSATEASQAAAEQQATAMSIDEMKAEIVRLTNAERAKAGLCGLEVLPELGRCAQAKADDFLANGYYGHDSPTYGTPGDMIKGFVPEAKSYAENIAPWLKTTSEAFDGWINSTKGHRENILNPKLTHIGIGVSEGAGGGYWWVQHFVKL